MMFGMIKRKKFDAIKHSAAIFILRCPMINAPNNASEDIIIIAFSGGVMLNKNRMTIEPVPAPMRSEPYNSPDFSLIMENADAIQNPKKRNGIESIM